MKLSAIYIYPIKSCAGISLEQAELTGRGIAYDRRWMLVDQEGKSLTQRESSEMALLQTAIDKQSLRIWHSRKKIAPLEIPLSIPKTQAMQVELWGDIFEASIYSEAANQWFSGIIGKACKLVYMHEESKRPVDPRYAIKDEIVSMADGYPYLIIGEAALAQLNQKLHAKGESSIPMDRFRPNLVFSGGEAHAEDNWKELSIGKTRFAAVKPCARCIMTTIDQQTGQAGKEPLKTLNQYRREGNKVLFGMNLLLLESGNLAVGNTIELIRT
ncbi:MAG: MOSC N-terminal beta barrel domain-containing protein [Bacteroidota bacterium]